mgnify:FL=1
MFRAGSIPSAIHGRVLVVLSEPTIARFWTKVDVREPGECWPWTAAVRSRTCQYGVLKVDGTVRLAHRLSFEIAYGEVPDGLFVCHTCDTPRCVNPAHLFAGSAQDNAVDAVQKGRMNPLTGRVQSGAANLNARLTDAVVVAIRRDREAGMKLVPLAAKYGVGYSTVRDIVCRRTWAHVS